MNGAVAISVGEDGEPVAEPDEEGDLCGHGTACAGVIRSLAPDAEIHSARVKLPGTPGTTPCSPSAGTAGRSTAGPATTS